MNKKKLTSVAPIPPPPHSTKKKPTSLQRKQTMAAISSWDSNIVSDCKGDIFGDDADDILPTAWQHHRHSHNAENKNLDGSPKRAEHSDKRRKGWKGTSNHGAADSIHRSLQTDSAVVAVSIGPTGRHIACAALKQTSIKPLNRFALPGKPAETQKQRKATAVDLSTDIMATGHADGCIMIHGTKGQFVSQCSKNPGKILSCGVSADGTMVAYGGGGYEKNPKRGWFRIMDVKKGTLIFAMKAGCGRNEGWSMDETLGKDEQRRKRSKSSYGVVRKDSSSGNTPVRTPSSDGTKIKRSKSIFGSHGKSGTKKMNGVRSKWLKAKRNVMGVMMAVNRQPAPSFDSSIRCCKLSAPCRFIKGKEKVCLLATGGKDKAVLIWKIPVIVGGKKQAKMDKQNKMLALEVLYRYPINSWCTCICFSEDASFVGYGTVNGRLRLHETSTGAQFQVFQPIDLTAPKQQDDGSATIKDETSGMALLKTDTSTKGLGGAKSNQARVSQCVLLVDDDAPHDAPSYDDDLVVYILEQKIEGKRWECHVVVRDVVSAAVFHTYCVSGAQSALALWASPTTVIIAARPTRVRGKSLMMHVHDLDAGMVWKSIRHGDGAGSKTAITSCCLSENGAFLAIADATTKITVYNAEEGSALVAFSQDARVQIISFSPDSKLLVAGGDGMKNGRQLTGMTVMRKMNLSKTPVSSPVASSSKESSKEMDTDGAWGAMNAGGSLWEVSHPGPVTDTKFCEGGIWLAVTDAEEKTSNTIKIYDTYTGTVIAKLPFAGSALQCDVQRYSLNNEPMMAAVGEGGLINIWTTTKSGSNKAFENITNRLDRHDDDHQHHCTVVNFSPCGQYIATGDAEGQVILREFVTHTRQSMDGNTEMSQLEIRSINYKWQNPGPISGLFFIDDGHKHTILVFCYWDSDDEAFRSRFIQLVGPMYPDHEWWGSAVAASGGRTSVNMKSRCGVIVVESLDIGRVTMMNLTDTVPLPSEMPMSGKDCGGWIKYSPYLVHRQDRTRNGETILHMLCGIKPIAPLQSYLKAAGKIAPIIDDNKKTPLDIAMYNNDYAKARLLLRAYIEWSTTGLLGLKKPLKQMAKQYPNLITEFLNKCECSIDCAHKRMQVNRPIVSYGQTLNPPWDGTEHSGEVARPVDASVIGFSGFMDSDGPYEAIVKYGDLSAFASSSLQLVTQFKWQQYGYPIYKALTILHFIITIFFSMSQVTQAFFPDWKSMQASRQHGAGWQWMIVQGTVCVCVLPFLFFEAKEAKTGGICSYLTDVSNYLEIINCVGVMTPIPFFFITGYPMPEVFTALLILTTWSRILVYLRAYELTGSLMRMIISILLKMRVFFLILIILLCGYVMSFTVLFPNRLQFRGQRFRVFITFFEAMLGEPLMNAMFQDPADTVGELNQTSAEFLEGEGDWLTDPMMVRMMLGQALLIFFYILVVVVMLNLLIAIMGNAYDEIAQNEAVEMQRARAEAILYIERNILFEFMEQWETFFPRYLHVLQPHKGEEDAEDETQATAEGRIEARKYLIVIKHYVCLFFISFYLFFSPLPNFIL